MNFLQPTTLADLAQCLAQKPEEGGFLLAGCTDFLVQRNGKPWDARMLISLVNLPQLRLIQLQDGFLSIGAACTHAQTQADPLIRTHFPALAAACKFILAMVILACSPSLTKALRQPVPGSGSWKGQPLSRELLPSLYQALSQEIQGSIPNRASMPYKRRAVKGLADDLLTELIRQARIPV